MEVGNNNTYFTFPAQKIRVIFVISDMQKQTEGYLLCLKCRSIHEEQRILMKRV